MRANYKDHHDQDIEKTEWYVKKLVDFLSELESATSANEKDR